MLKMQGYDAFEKCLKTSLFGGFLYFDTLVTFLLVKCFFSSCRASAKFSSTEMLTLVPFTPTVNKSTHVQYRRTDTVCQIDHTICTVCQSEKVVVDPLTV